MKQFKKPLKILLIIVAVLLVGAVLFGVLNALVGKGKWTLGWSDYSYDDSRYQIGDGSIPAARITAIDLDWIDGNVRVVACQDAFVSLTESADSELTDASRMRWYVNDLGELSIKYRKSSFFLGKSHNKNKDLILRVPERFFEGLKLSVNTRSANVFLEGIAAQEIVLNAETGNFAMLSDSSAVILLAKSERGKLLIHGSVSERMELFSKDGEIRVETDRLPDVSQIESKSAKENIYLLLSPTQGFSLGFETENGRYLSDFTLESSNWTWTVCWKKLTTTPVTMPTTKME